MKTEKLKIKGMHCNSCAMLIREDLKDFGVENVEVSYEKGIAVVKFDENKLKLDKIKNVIRKGGYEVE